MAAGDIGFSSLQNRVKYLRTLLPSFTERVLKGVVRWMKGGAGGVMRGEGLLRKIRFPFMSAEFLADETRFCFPESATD